MLVIVQIVIEQGVISLSFKLDNLFSQFDQENTVTCCFDAPTIEMRNSVLTSFLVDMSFSSFKLTINLTLNNVKSTQQKFSWLS